MITYDGLDLAKLGVASVWHPNGTRVDRVVYSADKIAEIYMQQGMDCDEAYEYISFNTDGGYYGEDTPIIVYEDFE